MTIQQATDLAAKLFGGGRFAEAEQVYRQILQQDPNHADATHALGVVTHQLGQKELAEKLIRRAIELSPDSAIYLQNLGDLLIQRHALDDADQALSRALKLNPNLPQAVMKLGLVREGQNRLDEAADLYRRAITLAPQYAEAHCNLGDVLSKLDRMPEALQAYEQSLRINPGLAAAYANRAVALEKLNRLSEAMADALRAIQLNPNLSTALVFAGRLYCNQRHLNEAAACFQRVLQLDPDSAEGHNGMSMVHLHRGEYEQASIECRRTIELNPKMVDPYPNLALALADLGRFDEALAAYDEAIRVHPGRTTAPANRSLLLLLKGDLENGFTDFEQRWELPEFKKTQPNFNAAKWEGQELTGKTILLWHEQGLGDTIQFVRYAKLLADKGARVIVQAQKPLHRILGSAPGVSQILARVPVADPIPPIDFQLPMMSLPHAFHTTLETIPAEVPYLQADPMMVQTWRDRLAEHRGFRVGICWRGGPRHRLDRERSVTAEHFLPLAKVEGVELINLQIGADAQPVPRELNLIDYADRIGDFADTATFIANIDLVISVDTALVHLAGAMGRPVWTLLPSSPDFRWLLNRDDSPWYPTMRLFRQPRFRDWPAVFARVAGELALHVR